MEFLRSYVTRSTSWLFVLLFSATTLVAAIPVINSPLTDTAKVGEAYTYTITAAEDPTSFDATGLPAGLSITGDTISGTPTEAGDFSVTIEAENDDGADSQTLELTVDEADPAPPQITSDLTDTAVVGEPYSYTITATGSPTDFNASTQLPPGLSRSGDTISGTPTEAGDYNITLAARNSEGWSVPETLVLTVNEVADVAPVITTPATKAGNVGAPFEFTIEAENSPSSITVGGLGAFPGLSYDSESATISGIPTAEVSGDLIVEATNGAGSDLQILSLTIGPVAEAPPEIVSSLSEEATVGTFFSYTIEATNLPISYSIGGDPLPDGMSRSGNVISGTPTESGIFNIVLTAINNFGADSKTLVLQVNDALPVITSPSSASGLVGEPFTYTITATNNPTSFSVVGLGAFPGLSFDSATGEISGTPTSAVQGDLFVQATNAQGSDSAIITISISSASNLVPHIYSSLNQTATAGNFFSYSIQATNNPFLFGISGDDLPAGLSRSGRTISGNPTETGIFNIEISATNSFGTDTETLVLEVVDTVPQITSLSSAVGEVGDNFEYQITASTSVDSYNAIGLDNIDGLTLDPATGLISGIPANTGSFDILLEATNTAGTGRRFLTVFILDSVQGDGPTVEIVSINGESPTSNPEFDNTTTSLDFVVEVTPDAGETLETVFLQWTNVPSTLGFNSVIVAELQPQGPIPTSGPVTYTGTAPVGFDPTNREIGGGQIELEVVATQRNADSELSFGTSDEATVVIEPLVEFLLPEQGVSQESIPAGGTFAVVRLSTNAFESVSASISGVGVIESVVDDNDNDNQNGVFSFAVNSEVSFPDVYTIVVRAEDSLGNLVEITRDFEIVNDTSSPVAVIANPTPGFRNDVFSPGSFTWFLDDSQFERNDAGDITKSTYTYILEPVSRGQGYFPRNQEDARLFYSFYDEAGFLAGSGFVDGNTVDNGRVTQVAETVVFDFRGFVPSFGLTGIGLVDSSSDPGIDSRIEIVADLFKADADLQSFRLFINGNEVTPGSGNLNPDDGPISVPVLTYPRTGSLTPGEYVVTAEVTDQNGEVGISRPLVFTIDPFEELDVVMTANAQGEVDQGETVTYLVEVTPNDSLDTVEVFDSVTNESLGFASRVTINGGIFYRFTRTYEQAGTFGIYARATTFSGQQVISNQISLDVLAFNDATVAITSPDNDTVLTFGQTLTFSAQASSTPGIASITWFVNNNPVETVSGSSSSYNFVSGEIGFSQGTYNVTVSAIDNFGNQVGSDESIQVRVVSSDIAVSITSPSSGETVFEGAELTFTASASATVGITSVEWFVNGASVETDSSAPFRLDQNFTSAGDFSVVAVATDELGNTASSSAVTVTALPSNPLLRDEDFVTDIYERLLGATPTSDQQAEALAQLDGTLASRSQYVVDLIETDDFEVTLAAFIIYRTMTGEWPNSEESDQALEDIFGEFNQSSEFTGTILPFGTVPHTLNFGTVGTRVRARVEGDNSNGFGLTDPTLQIFGPRGFIAFDDDSGFSLNPEIIFNVTAPGTHTFFVGGFSSRAGEYTLIVESFGDENNVGEINADALTSSLEAEYVERFGSFNASNDTVIQLFENKHAGVMPSALTQNRLLSSASEEYPGDFISFVTDFALDNDLSNFVGPGGVPLTSVLFYPQPNNPEEDALLAALIARILGEDPTDAAIAALAANSLAESVQSVLSDERYYGQFDTSNVEGEVAQYMAGFGIFDLSENGLTDDPDGDGFTNEAEFNAGTNPNDSSDTPEGSSAAWYANASALGNGWLYFDWFKAFNPTSGNWIYHARHGWLYVVADDTSSMFLWDNALGRWMYTNENVYPWMYAFGSNGGWVWFFENGSPGARFFARGDNDQIVSEDQLSENP